MMYSFTSAATAKLPGGGSAVASRSSRLAFRVIGVLGGFLVGCDDGDANAANLVGLGWCIGLLTAGGLFLALVEPWFQWLRAVERMREPETLADEIVRQVVEQEATKR